jgi:hypothetical protein
VATPDYYLILGVAPDETARGIKAAYRQRAKQLHPDVAGHAAAGAFRELTEAYGVLSDPAQRRLYDGQIRPARHRPPPEPLIPTHRRAPAAGTPRLDYALRLTPEQARYGCVVPIRLPTRDVVGVRVPSMTPNGTVFRIAIEGVLELRLQLSVQAWL